MGLIYGLVKRIFKAFLYFLIFAAIVVFIPNLPPYTKFTSIKLDPTQARIGPLAPNDALNNAEKVYENKLLGPEVFQVYKGDLYTSLATGEIVKVSPGGHVTFVTKIGQPCSGLHQEHICGRPLGLQIDENKNVIYISDAYLGIWKVDLKNDKKQLLVSPRVAIEGRQPKLFNSLALSKTGDFYWTDSSSDFHLKDGAFSSFTDPSGRLFHYNAAKNESKVLLDDLWFSNGLVLSPDNQFVVVAETLRFRLLKYYVDGPNKGKSEVLTAGLPGFPDNVRVLPDGSGILAALYTAFDEENPMLSRSLAPAPLARKFVARIMRLLEIPFEYINTIYPHVVFEEVVYHIGHFKSMSSMLPKMAGLAQIDWNGNIVATYFNTDGTLKHISDAIVYNNRLYTGNPHEQNFIGSVPVPPLLKKAFETKPEPAPKQAKPKTEDKPKVEVKKEIPKPAAQMKPAQQQAKPAEAVKPTPAETKAAPKPVEQPKPAPKPVEQPKPAQKPVQSPKPDPKPVEKPKPAQPKPATSPPAKTDPPKAQPTPKAEIKTPPTTPKPAPKATQPPAKATSEAKPAAAKPEIKVKPIEKKPVEDKPQKVMKPAKEVPKPSNKPEQIPIKEEIPSDTAKPAKETLKVIKKGGPTEIPNPNL